MVVIPIVVMLIGQIIGARIESEEFEAIWSRGMGVGFLLLLVGILLKVYTKIVKPLIESAPKRVMAESEQPTGLVSKTQAEALPGITEYTTELLIREEVKGNEQRPAKPGN
jgi:hypothetical protein